MKREEVNDAQLYGIGVKRLKEKQRINLKKTPNEAEPDVDCCVYINCGGNFKFLLALFAPKTHTDARKRRANTFGKVEDDNVAKIFDVKTFAEI